MKTLLLIFIITFFGCFDQETPTTKEDILKCSYSFTSNYGYKVDPSRVFRDIYGEYSIDSLTKIQINPSSKYYFMRKIPGNQWEIVASGMIEVNIDEYARPEEQNRVILLWWNEEEQNLFSQNLPRKCIKKI